MSERAAVDVESEFGADGRATLTLVAPVMEAQRSGAVEALGAALRGYDAPSVFDVVPTAGGLMVTVECRIKDSRALQELVYNTVLAFLPSVSDVPVRRHCIALHRLMSID